MGRLNVGRVAIAGVALLHLAAAAIAAESGHEVTVTAGKEAVIDAPVTVALPEGLRAESAVLTDEATKSAVVTQADTSGGKPAITFILPALGAGESKQYSLKAGSPPQAPADQGVKLKETGEGLEVWIDGKLFTTYHTKSGPRPYCWPLIGPTGETITRDYPMRKDVANEEHDHPHHRSLFFGHLQVSGHDFWSEKADKSFDLCTHKAFGRIEDGPVFGEFVSEVEWTTDKGAKFCNDVRRMRFYRVADSRLFDFEIDVKAGAEPVIFGDDKDGTFAIRVAGPMSVIPKKKAPKSGTIVNANGDRDIDAWGKRATWCDYYGPLAGGVVGVTFFDHPTNLRHPTYWHVRDYGLFAANPFGVSHFLKDKSQNGSYTIPPGSDLKLLYRVYIHKGETASAHIPERYSAFAAPVAVTVK